MELLKRNKLLVIVIAIALAGFLWYSLSNRGTPSPVLVESQAAPEEQAANSTIVQSLLQLRSITLSGTIFVDPAFAILKDFSTQIVPEPVGRPNPFAPLGSSGFSTSTPVLPQQPPPPRR